MKTRRTTVRRSPARGYYDKESLYEVLDAGFLCHVGFIDEGNPFVIPTAYGRDDNHIYIHGATKSRMIQVLENGGPACITVTHMDGIVLARSVFHHSMNYRSAVILGTATPVVGSDKTRALEIISDQILAGRWEEAREPNAKELKATKVLKFELEEASVKIRTGPPKDDEADYKLAIWAGVLPIEQQYGEPIEDLGINGPHNLPRSIKSRSNG